jgi:Ca2+-binding EF-hand superfamily protein
VVQRLREAFVAHAGGTDSAEIVLDAKKFSAALGLPHNTLTQRMFTAFNVTKSKKMNFREFAMAAALLSSRAPKEDKIRFSFDLYDLNGDKLIDRGELKEMLLAILTDAPLRLSDAEIDAVCINTFMQSAAALANLPASQALASKSKSQTRSNTSKTSGKHAAEGEVMEFEAYRALVLTVPRLLNAFSVDLDALLVTRSNVTVRFYNFASTHSDHIFFTMR